MHRNAQSQMPLKYADKALEADCAERSGRPTADVSQVLHYSHYFDPGPCRLLACGSEDACKIHDAILFHT